MEQTISIEKILKDVEIVDENEVDLNKINKFLNFYYNL